jgi:DNA-directed RNA polymerase subunit L
MKIQNIKVNNYNIEYENSKFKELINNNKHLLPNLNKNSISFDIIDTNEAFANAIRRVYTDELLVKCLDINVHNLVTNDKYILTDNIKERINLISLSQNIPIETKFNLNVVNNTNDIINIYTKDITNKNKNDKKSYFNNNIQICSLKPNRFINISDIYINKDYGYNNAIYSLGSWKYKAINVDFNISSLNNNVKDFHLELINNYNIDIKDIINNIYENLYLRLKTIQSSIKDYVIHGINTNSEEVNNIMNASNDLYIINNKLIKDSNILDINGSIPEEISNIYEIHINNEYHTIGNLITKYVFLQEPNIELINYKLIHPLTHKIVIIIKHSEYKKIINDAIEQIIKDLVIFKTSIINILK